jgi:hypothetical protein
MDLGRMQRVLNATVPGRRLIPPTIPQSEADQILSGDWVRISLAELSRADRPPARAAARTKAPLPAKL